MLRSFTLALAGLMGFFWAQICCAWVEAEYIVSAYEGEMSQQTFALHVDPLPVPLSIGASFNEGNDTIEAERISESVDLELRIWAPLYGLGIVPYVRFGYILNGRGEAVSPFADTASVLETKDVQGQRASFGVAVNPMPFISLMLEASSRSYAMTFSPPESRVDLASFERRDNRTEYRTGISIGL